MDLLGWPAQVECACQVCHLAKDAGKWSADDDVMLHLHVETILAFIPGESEIRRT
jgi:hypothetical protein